VSKGRILLTTSSSDSCRHKSRRFLVPPRLTLASTSLLLLLGRVPCFFTTNHLGLHTTSRIFDLILNPSLALTSMPQAILHLLHLSSQTLLAPQALDTLIEVAPAAYAIIAILSDVLARGANGNALHQVRGQCRCRFVL
jgi:hypothetical protein